MMAPNNDVLTALNKDYVDDQKHSDETYLFSEERVRRQTDTANESPGSGSGKTGTNTHVFPYLLNWYRRPLAA
jgi:hypothetical protein